MNTLHNTVHLLAGVLGVAAAYTGWPRLYNRVVGIVYLVVGILGFIPVLIIKGLLLGLVSINLSDNLLHLVAGIVLVYIGFFLTERVSAAKA